MVPESPGEHIRTQVTHSPQILGQWASATRRPALVTFSRKCCFVASSCGEEDAEEETRRLDGARSGKNPRDENSLRILTCLHRL